jgi:hypothetical protein
MMEVTGISSSPFPPLNINMQVCVKTAAVVVITQCVFVEVKRTITWR